MNAPKTHGLRPHLEINYECVSNILFHLVFLEQAKEQTQPDFLKFILLFLLTSGRRKVGTGSASLLPAGYKQQYNWPFENRNDVRVHLHIEQEVRSDRKSSL